MNNRKHSFKFNNRGTAGNMETVSGKRIWERSVENNCLRYLKCV